MTNAMTDQLKQLSEAATEGEWFVLDTKHLSNRTERIFDDRTGRPANAKFVRELVNAYRAGEFVPASELTEAKAREAVAYEVAATEAERYAGHYKQGSDGRNTFVIFADLMRQKASEAAQ